MIMKTYYSRVLIKIVLFYGIMQMYFNQHNGMESIKNNNDIACFYVPQKLLMFNKN